MIQMIFSVKFQSQLQRTRPYLYDSLKKSIVASVDGSGGRIRRCFHSIIADFNENEIGFWIDILTVLGNGYQAIEKNKRELFGYLCVLSENMDDSAVSLLMKTLPSQVQASGIWCSSHVRAALGSFAEFSTKDYAISVNSQMNSFSEIESIKTESYTSCKNPLLDKVSAIIEKDRIQNTVLTGAKYIGKRECLHWYCDNFEQDTVPLTIRFGKYLGGLCCFVDALSPAIRHFLTPAVDAKPGNEELFMLHEQLFRERLRVEPSKYTLRIGRRYVYLLLNAYCERALSEGKTPIVILENIQKVPYDAAQIFSDIYREAAQDRQLVLYATCSSQTIPSLFKDFFPRIINCSHDHIPVFTAGNISLSLWEIAYACYLFGKYFPPYDFLDLFCAEGKNKDTIRKILYLLYQRNIIRSIEAPNPELIAFREGVEKILGERAAYIRAMVKNRLLAWISDRKVVPCYNLLEALHSFGLDISDSLALEAIRSDLMNDAFKSIENSIIDGSFYAVVGNERAAALQYCFRSLKALLFGSGEFIKESARNLKREDSPTPLYKSQILIIDAAFKMALRDISGALAAAKEAMMIIQGSKEKKEIAQVYRLFALVHLSRKELPDAVEYLSFSVEEAEAHKDSSELAVSLYYAATAHFLLG
ncbi:MAG: hypothetical protein LBV68_08680, partial [Spirochaetaceae bacterium]|nr:hypothetical protein [Spirochaetaceae bacterium]